MVWCNSCTVNAPSQSADTLLLLAHPCVHWCRVKAQCQCTKSATCLLASSGVSVVTLGATRVVDLDTGTGSLAQVAATCTLQLETKVCEYFTITKKAFSWLKVLRICYQVGRYIDMDPSTADLFISQIQFIYLVNFFWAESVITNYTFLVYLQIISKLKVDHNKILW